MALQRRRPFVFWSSCVQLKSGELVDAIRRHPRSEQISYKTFARHVDLDELRKAGHPAMYRISAPDNWSITFYQSLLPNGQRVYYFVWSGIKHFFVDSRIDTPNEKELVAMLEPDPNPAPDKLPVRPDHLLLVRIREGAELLPEYLYFVFLYLRGRRVFEALSHGACQQCITARDVASIPVEGGRRLGDFVTVKTRFRKEDLRPGDILLQRVGSTRTCGTASLVSAVDPLSLRTDNPAGGLAAGRSPGDFDARQLASGTRVELEHTSDPKLAEKIAMDHLVEHPDYYEALAVMEAQLQQRRATGNPKARGGGVGSLAVPRQNPSIDDWNIYINFVLYAVEGKMREADQLLEEHGDSIRRAARAMRKRGPLPRGNLYRGLLLEDASVRRGEIERDERLRFESYTQDRDVACWFADPRSVISGLVAAQRPGASAYLTSIDAHEVAERVLWWHPWDVIVVSPRVAVPLEVAAHAHPEIGGQFTWNRRTQSEVLLAAGQGRIAVARTGDCPPIDVLDERYTWPPALAALR